MKPDPALKIADQVVVVAAVVLVAAAAVAEDAIKLILTK